MPVQIQLRRDTAAQWTAINPILAQGEPGYETDTGLLKHGDGVTHWNALTYFGPSISGAAGGVLTGSYPNPTFASDMATQTELNVAVSGAVNDGDTAGGVLSGTYPNPGFAVNMATQAELDLRTLITPEDLGAAGDGVRDDWAEVQAAFDLGVAIRLKGAYMISKPIEYVNRLTAVYVQDRNVALICHSSWSSIHHQIIRNWREADWTGGETDHRVAPANHSYSISSPSTHNYYPRIIGGQLNLNTNGKTNVACFSWATPNERARVEGLRCNTNTGTEANTGNWGIDIQGVPNGFICKDLVLYGVGWERQISVNCQGASGADVYFLQVTFSPGKVYHSKFYINNCDDVVLRDWHMESGGGIDAASNGWIWLYSHTGFGSWTLDNGDFTINDGTTTTKPIIKVTSQTSDHTNLSAPQVRRLKIHKYTGTFNGNVVEDFWQTLPRNGTFQGKTITDMTLLHYYDGNIVSWANSNATQDLYTVGLISLASPTFTGDPKAPTPTAGDNDTSIATTAFVTAAITASGGGFVYAAAAPTTGAHTLHELVWNSTPEPGGNIGWVCTTAGTPGTWKPFGEIGL